MVPLCPNINHFKLEVTLCDTESIFIPKIIPLKENGSSYPVTLVLIPLQYMDSAMKFASRESTTLCFNVIQMLCCVFCPRTKCFKYCVSKIKKIEILALDYCFVLM